ncbi:NucA/NucB deoxyribonuclease domain-containing protein [Paenibacillus glycanilyticus]|uniref:NucA/NucB deoxyribonuclease domain-containing protein n=1 Tax=Paenibacillus glycanilyticus TaxID=126569 RepID=UPI003EBB37B6
MKKLLAILFVAILIYVVPRLDDWQGQPGTEPASSSSYTLEFPADRYPETAKHIREAMASGESKICTIDRENAEENRKESLKDIPTKKGYDRDEWPMAMCKEGGDGADIAYIAPSDNRGAGAWVSNQLDTFPDGTRVEFIVK